MSVICVAVLFNGTSNVHGRQKGKDKGLDKRNHDLDKVEEQGEKRDHRSNDNALENEDQTKKT